jgi:hypothetical protein
MYSISWHLSVYMYLKVISYAHQFSCCPCIVNVVLFCMELHVGVFTPLCLFLCLLYALYILF